MGYQSQANRTGEAGRQSVIPEGARQGEDRLTKKGIVVARCRPFPLIANQTVRLNLPRYKAFFLSVRELSESFPH